MNQSEYVRYWSASEQNYKYYSPFKCGMANQNMSVELGKSYVVVKVTKDWKGIIP
jgi:hypothetical protein